VNSTRTKGVKFTNSSLYLNTEMLQALTISLESCSNFPDIDNPVSKTISLHIKTTLKLKQFKIMSCSSTSTTTICRLPAIRRLITTGKLFTHVYSHRCLCLQAVYLDIGQKTVIILSGVPLWIWEGNTADNNTGLKVFGHWKEDGFRRSMVSFIVTLPSTKSSQFRRQRDTKAYRQRVDVRE